jgi:hypothetical protein
MKKLLTISLSVAVGFLFALLVLEPRPRTAIGAEKCSARNGDVNADGNLDLSDAITIIGHLFLGTPTTLAPLCAQPGAPSPLPATGQNTCSKFDPDQSRWVEVVCTEATCFGQDGFYFQGCPPDGRFVDNNDGTVTDNCTGLMWQKDTADVSDLFADTLNWCDALVYCEDLSFAGHNDWRLPNVRELQSIVDYGRANQAIDPVFTALPEFYWSSSSYVDTHDDAWGIGFHVGYVGIRPKEGDADFSFNYVRAVRNAP